MVKLVGKTELAKAVEPVEGETYKITAAEDTKTAVQGFKAVRVSLESIKPEEKEKEFATMLWAREVAGISSKMGSFLHAFGEYLGDEDMALDTDNWIGKTIRIVSWKEKKREIRVLE